MAAITEYTSPVDTLKVDESGVNALMQAAQHTAGAAFHIQRFKEQTGSLMSRAFGEIGQGVAGLGKPVQLAFGDEAAREEKSKGGLLVARTIQDLTEQQAKIASDPATMNNPTALNKWYNETAVPAIQKLGEGFQSKTGKDYITSQQDALFKHFGERVAADKITLSATSANANLVGTIQAGVATVSTDPSAMASVRDHLSTVIDSQFKNNPQLGARGVADAQKFKDNALEQVTQMGLSKSMLADPETFKKHWNSNFFDADKKFLSPQAIMSFDKAIDTAIKMKKADEKGHQAELDRQAADTSSDAAQGYLRSFVGPDGNYKIPPNIRLTLAQDTRLSKEDFQSTLAAVDRLSAKGDVQSDRAVLADLNAQFLAHPPGDPNRPTLADVNKHAGLDLSIRDVDWLHKTYIAPKDQATKDDQDMLGERLKEAQSAFNNPMVSGTFGAKNQKYGDFQRWFLPKVRDAQAHGQAMSDILDMGSPIMKEAEKRWPGMFSSSGTGATDDTVQKALAVGQGKAAPPGAPKKSLGEILFGK